MHVSEMEKLIQEHKQIPLTLELCKPLDAKMANVKIWKEQLAKTFRIRSPSETLLKVTSTTSILSLFMLFLSGMRFRLMLSSISAAVAK